MPRDHSAVFSGFAKKLIVPEPYPSAQKLARRHRKRRVPEYIVEARRDSPCSECVEQDAGRVRRFVGVVLVKQFVAGVVWVEKALKFGPQFFDLLVSKDANPAQVAILVVERDLIIVEPVFLPLCGSLGK
jgi:hypothetical protein